jgi:hypothetical protein
MMVAFRSPNAASTDAAFAKQKPTKKQPARPTFTDLRRRQDSSCGTGLIRFQVVRPPSNWSVVVIRSTTLEVLVHSSLEVGFSVR